MQAQESDSLLQRISPISGIINRIGMGKFQEYLRVLGALGSLIVMIQCTLIGLVAYITGEMWSLSSAEITFFTASNLIGMGVGFFISSALENTAGRWELYKAGQWMYLVFSVLSSFCFEIYTLTLARTMTVVGTFIFMTPSYASISEMVPSQYRGQFIASFEYVVIFGNLALPVCVYFLVPGLESDNWRLAVALFGLVPGIPSLALTYYLIDDSPIYLSKRNKPNQAIAALERMAAFNGQPALSQEEKFSVYDKLENMIGRVSVAKFFRKDYLKRTIFLIILWNITTLGYNGVLSIYPYLLELDGNSSGILISIFFIGVVQFPVMLLYSFLIDHQRIGRRYTMIIATLACLVATLVPILVENEWAVICSASTLVAVKYVINITCYIYTFEKYNTEMRGSATAYVNVLARFVVIGAPYMLMALIKAGNHLSFIVLAALELVMLISIVCLAEETVGKRLDADQPISK